MSRKSKEKIEENKVEESVTDIEAYVNSIRKKDIVTIICALFAAVMMAAGIIMLKLAIEGGFGGFSTFGGFGGFGGFSNWGGRIPNSQAIGSFNDLSPEEIQAYGTLKGGAGALETDLYNGETGDHPNDEGSESNGAEDLTSPFIGEDDIVHFLGGSFYELQQRFSSSEQIVTQTSHYFVDEYLGVTYEYENGQILTLENDGPGRMPITLAGISIGMSFSEVDEMLSGAGIDFYPSEDYDENSGVLPMKFSAGVDNMRFEATVEFEDYVVTDILCRCKYR